MGRKRSTQPKFEEGAKVFITVRGKEIPAQQYMIDVSTLQFYPENPRIYSIVRNHGKHPSQDDIEQSLQSTEHVRELTQDIKRNGGLIDPLYVKDGTFEVIEGNCRLAALKNLYSDDAVKWGRAKCVLLPPDIDQKSISALLGQWHLKGKKEWPPYEQAGFLYRRHRKQGVDLERLALEVGVAKQRISILVDAYEFMEDCDDREHEHWSYYLEYLRSKKIKRAREQFSKLDKVVIRGIKGGQFGRAQDFRDWLPVVCENSKVLKRFVEGELDLEEAHERAVEAGGENTPYKRLKKFRLWLAGEDAHEDVSSAEGKLRDNIRFELSKIHTISGRLSARLE